MGPLHARMLREGINGKHRRNHRSFVKGKHDPWFRSPLFFPGNKPLVSRANFQRVPNS